MYHYPVLRHETYLGYLQTINEDCIKYKAYSDYVKDLFGKYEDGLHLLRAAHNAESYKLKLSSN